MTDPKIIPEKITKPIQLLAAWLGGLVIVNGSFLGTAVALSQPEWLRVTLVLASIANVPIFLICLFLLQTKFRPQMQEDQYYSKYLEQNTGRVITVTPTETAIESVRAEIIEANQRQFALITGLEAGLNALALQVSKGMPESSGDSRSDSEVRRVVREVRQSTHALELAKERAEDAQVSVQLNDMLPDFGPIRRELKSVGVKVDEVFGSTAERPEVPKVRVIGFGSAVPVEVLRRVVRATEKFGFDHIHYADERKRSKEALYIGSFVYRNPKAELVPITDDLRRIIDDPDARLDDVVHAMSVEKA